MNKKDIIILVLFSMTFVGAKSQSIDIKLTDIIEGKWNIEYRGEIVTTNNPNANDNIDLTLEILKAEDGKIEFGFTEYTLNSDKSGKFIIKGTSLYLDNKKYHVAIHNKDKFNLIRKINSDCSLAYMIVRNN